MVIKHTTSSGREVWICEVCRKRRKSESAATNHQLTCRGRPKDKVNNYSEAKFKTNHKAGSGYKCCKCEEIFKSIKVIGQHHICKKCLEITSKQNGGKIDLSMYKSYM